MTRQRRSKRGTVTLDLILLASIVVVLGLVIVPSYERSAALRELRECYSIQRRLLAAVEAYEADSGKQAGELQTMIPTLVSDGYLPAPPVDPGTEGTGSSSHYGSSVRGTIYCWVHGSPWACGPRPPASPAPVPRDVLDAMVRAARARSASPSATVKPPSVRRFPGLWR